MTHPVREVGLGLRGDLPHTAYRELGVAAEGAGFDVLSVFGDLGFQPPLPALLLAAQETRRIRLGPACLNPYTTHPVEIAGQIAMLDHVSGGRAFLGLARGAWLDEVGVTARHPLTALRDAHAIVSRLLAGDDGGYEGAMFSLEPGLRLRYPVLRRTVPLLIGSWGERLTGLAGEIADELKVGGTASPTVVAVARGRLDRAAIEVGRASGSTGVVMGAVTVVDKDGKLARQAARAAVAMYIAVVGGLDPTSPIDPELLLRLQGLVAEGDEAAAGRLLSEGLLLRHAFAGTPAEVARQTEELYAAGAKRVDFGQPLGIDGVERGFGLLARGVLPRLSISG